MSPLAGTKHTSVRLAIVKFSHFFKVVWHIMQMAIGPDCHHHFDASGTSNAMFDELAERSLMSPLAGTKHTCVRLAIVKFSDF